MHPAMIDYGSVPSHFDMRACPECVYVCPVIGVTGVSPVAYHLSKCTRRELALSRAYPFPTYRHVCTRPPVEGEEKPDGWEGPAK